MKNKAAGFYTAILTAILAAAGLIFCLINCSTAYFSNLGKDPVVLACAIAAILLEIAEVVIANTQKPLPGDLLTVAAPVLLALALILFTASRVNGIASIMTFENNAQTMSDLSSAIIAIALFAVALIAGLVNAFLDVKKN